MANLNVLWWIWNCRSEFEFAVVNFNLLWWIWMCCGEFEFTVVNLKLPQWIWICSCEFEFAMVNLKFMATHKCHDKTLNSFRNTLLFGAKFLIICLITAKFLPRGKTFLPGDKTSSPRQSFLSRGKLLKARQIFLSGGKAFLPLQNVLSNLCTSSGGGVGGGGGGGGTSWRGWQGSRVRLFYRSYFFQVLARSMSHFSTFF